MNLQEWNKNRILQNLKPITEKQMEEILEIEENKKKDFKVKFVIETERTIRAEDYKKAREWMACQGVTNQQQGEKHEVVVYVEDLETNEKYIHKNFQWEKVKKKKIRQKEDLTLKDFKEVMDIKCRVGIEGWGTMENAYKSLGEGGEIIKEIFEGKIELIDSLNPELTQMVVEKWGINPIILGQILSRASKSTDIVHSSTTPEQGETKL